MIAHSLHGRRNPDPRTGAAASAGEHAIIYQKTFTPPAAGPEKDWILIRDAAARNYPPPGQRR